MLIKFLKDEYIFDSQGLGIGDDLGFHLRAQEEMLIEIDDDKCETVLSYLKDHRASLGLDAEGNPIPEPQPQNEQLNTEASEPGVENGV